MISGLRKIFLTSINRIGQIMPKRLQRCIADFPGTLKLLEKLSNSELVEIPTLEGDSLFINPLFHYALVQSGGVCDFEPEIRNIILKLTKPGMVAYDIGANVGVYSLLFASIVGDDGIVYSFEPEENNYRCFERTLERLDHYRIVLDKRAVGKSKGWEPFDRRGGAFSGRLVGTGRYSATQNIKMVDTVSIDHVVEAEGYRVPDIVKIDVEGNEGMVLEGMKRVLVNNSPIVICELHTHLGDSTAQVTDLLSSGGYTISGVQNALKENRVGNGTSNGPLEAHIVAVKVANHD